LGHRSDRFCLDIREELNPREKLKPSSDRSPDLFHGSKWDFEDSRGTSWATLGYKLGPQNPLNQEESKVNPQEHLPMETTENTQVEAVLEGLFDQDHQAERYKVLIRDIQQKTLKETPSKLPHEKSKKRLRKSPKRKNERNTTKP
jgi:hypothetical protein